MMKIIPLVPVLADPGTAKVLQRTNTAVSLAYHSEALQNEANEHYQVLSKALVGREYTAVAMLVALWTLISEIVDQVETEMVEERAAQVPTN